MSAIVLDAGLAEVCGVEQAGAQFEFDSATLGPEGEAVARQLAACLDQGALAQKSIAVIGHTDPRGPDEYNLALGMSRAESVAKELARHGVAPDRIETMTVGDAHAQADPEGWPGDRRVDIRVVGE